MYGGKRSCGDAESGMLAESKDLWIAIVWYAVHALLLKAHTADERKEAAGPFTEYISVELSIIDALTLEDGPLVLIIYGCWTSIGFRNQNERVILGVESGKELRDDLVTW
ncbi:hypothetical protein N7517_007746 [Penicillium concentricum]|uniref:Uncharacterized protein n=1 Tax=Penicillium concentricum TaxID=293559 RepID=A0A9W9SCA3_9EURO|nr:uncharacterized protein N7517_007746 [Penicillium concentricum]KAJ5375740.1 hypothetical protein N7517_007746 [Penicillium concentricum]